MMPPLARSVPAAQRAAVTPKTRSCHQRACHGSPPQATAGGVLAALDGASPVGSPAGAGDAGAGTQAVTSRTVATASVQRRRAAEITGRV